MTNYKNISLVTLKQYPSNPANHQPTRKKVSFNKPESCSTSFLVDGFSLCEISTKKRVAAAVGGAVILIGRESPVRSELDVKDSARSLLGLASPMPI